MAQEPAVSGANYFHVDVFATGPLTGNGLAVFVDAGTWSATSMQRVAQEMRQFESIFLSDVSPAGAAARVFTVEEELPFAGHPLLGAAAVLHRTQAPEEAAGRWTVRVPHGPVVVKTRQHDGHYRAALPHRSCHGQSPVAGADPRKRFRGFARRHERKVRSGS